MKVTVTMDSGAAGHVMLDDMCPRVKLSLWQRMVNKSETWVRRPFHSRQVRGFTDACHSGARAWSKRSNQRREQ